MRRCAHLPQRLLQLFLSGALLHVCFMNHLMSLLRTNIITRHQINTLTPIIITRLMNTQQSRPKHRRSQRIRSDQMREHC